MYIRHDFVRCGCGTKARSRDRNYSLETLGREGGFVFEPTDRRQTNILLTTGCTCGESIRSIQWLAAQGPVLPPGFIIRWKVSGLHSSSVYWYTRHLRILFVYHPAIYVHNLLCAHLAYRDAIKSHALRPYQILEPRQKSSGIYLERCVCLRTVTLRAIIWLCGADPTIFPIVFIVVTSRSG